MGAHKTFVVLPSKKKLISSPGAKYADLVEDCREAGWKATMCPVEVGCRGFVGLGFGTNH